jgi:hypothetical protein
MTLITDLLNFTRRQPCRAPLSGASWPLIALKNAIKISTRGVWGLIWLFLASGAAAQSDLEPTKEPAKATAYEDQVIGGDQPEGSLGSSGTEIQLDPVGYRSSTAEIKVFSANSSRGYRESFLGVQAAHRWEGLHWGDWAIEGSGVSEQSNTLFSTKIRGGRWQLQQLNLALTPYLTVNNGVGFLRSYLPSVAQFSSQSVATRFSLPGPGFFGLNSQWSREPEPLTLATNTTENESESSAWRIALDVGRLTKSSGASGYAEEQLKGQTVGLHGSFRWDLNTVSAASLVQLRDSLQWERYMAVHAEQLFALTALDAQIRIQAIAQQGQSSEIALDSSANGSRKGFWFDAQRRANVRNTRVAGWFFDPGLYWYDNLLSSGQKGFAWHEEFSDSSFQWSLGAEINQYDGGSNARAGQRSVSASGSINYRIDRWQSWNLSGSVLNAKPTFDDGISSERQYFNLDFAYGLGQKRFSDQFKLVFAQSQVSAQTQDKTSRLFELLWSRHHQEFRALEFDFTIGLGYNQQDGVKRLRPHLRASRHWTRDGWLDGSLAFSYARDTSSLSTSYVTGLTALINAKLNRELSLQLSASISQSQQSRQPQQPLFGNTALNDSLANRFQDRALWLSLRYAWAGGTSLVGNMPGTGAGVGQIRGIAYYDDNADGIRQPNEKPAARVNLSLDGVLSVTTEADGSFDFPVVRSGKHFVRIDAASVRLPYGVNDELIRNLVVTPRSSIDVSIALPKLSD